MVAQKSIETNYTVQSVEYSFNFRTLTKASLISKTTPFLNYYGIHHKVNFSSILHIWWGQLCLSIPTGYATGIHTVISLHRLN